MVGHPYNAAYLQEIAETQGSLFERLQDVSPEADGCAFIRSYMKSDTRLYLDKGDVYLATLGPRGLMDYYQAEDAPEIKRGAPMRGFAPNRIGLIDEFVACIREHKTPLINLKWHKETIQAMLGCYESIASGKIARVGGK